MMSKLMPVLVNSVVLLSVIGLSGIIAPARNIHGIEAINVNPAVEQRIDNIIDASADIVIDQINNAAATIFIKDAIESDEIEQIDPSIIEGEEISAANLNNHITESIIEVENTGFDIDEVFSPIERPETDYIYATASQLAPSLQP